MTPKTLHIAKDYEAMSRVAERFVAKELRRKPNALICLATGESPERLYRLMGERFQSDPALFSQVRSVKLDEWGGLAMSDPGSCEAYIQQRILRPLHVERGRYFGWKSQPKDPEAECRRVADWLAANGPVDVNILGVGRNGHLGLNEPAAVLHAGPHVAVLAKSSMGHSMLSEKQGKVEYGLTLGMGDLLCSRKVVLLASGRHKAAPLRRMLSGGITTRFPASLLMGHSELHVFCDEAAAALLPDGASMVLRATHER